MSLSEPGAAQQTVALVAKGEALLHLGLQIACYGIYLVLNSITTVVVRFTGLRNNAL